MELPGAVLFTVKKIQQKRIRISEEIDSSLRPKRRFVDCTISFNTPSRISLQSEYRIEPDKHLVSVNPVIYVTLVRQTEYFASVHNMARDSCETTKLWRFLSFS